MLLPVLNKRWTLRSIDAYKVEALHSSLKISKTLCKLLVARGISDFEAAKSFFRPDLSMLHNPLLMKDMEKAVERISNAIEWNERILVYGDYDVDGTTAVSVVYKFLKDSYSGQIDFYIPHRYKEGYGLSKQGVDYAIANGYTLLITLDCGIKSVTLIDYAQKHNIDVIVCDHHFTDGDLPPAFAILNPKQPNCNYPFKELSGCGIGYKLIQALSEKWKLQNEKVEKYLDLVATSIAADIVPINDENRVLAFWGLKRINTNPCIALKVLKEQSGVKQGISLNLSDLVFVIGPKINAAGRMDDARKVVELFTQDDYEKAVELSSMLMTDNNSRKEIDKNITEEAIQILENDDLLHTKKSTVLYQEHWHKGVVGIVASRIIEHCYKPTIVLTSSNGKISGSARSVIGFNVYDAIDKCSDLLDNYGGHFYAAGVTMSIENYPKFVEKFEEIVATNIKPEMLIPEIIIDAEIELSEIKKSFYNIICQFEPFGPENLRPVFCTRRVNDFQNNSRIVKDQHIKFSITNIKNDRVEGIGFKMADKFKLIEKGKPFDIVYTIDENEFNGNKKIQIKVIDIKPS